MQNRVNLTRFTDYAMIYLLIGFTGVNFFSWLKIHFVIVVMIIAAVIFYNRGRKLDKFIIFYLLFYVFLMLGQTLKFYFMPLETFIGTHVRILFAYFVIRILEEKFLEYYVNIIYYSAIISFFFYFPSYIPGVEPFLKYTLSPALANPFLEASTHYGLAPSFIIYTVNTRLPGSESLLRNPGPFWEPAAFAGFIVLAILFNTIMEKNMFNKKGKVLLFALITTFSTTALIVVAIVITAYVMSNSSGLVKAIFIPTMAVVGTLMFTQVDFIGKKLTEESNVEEAQYNNRFKSASLDFADALENPVFGLGRAAETRFKGETDPILTHRNNGVSDYMACFGFVGFIFYFSYIYYTFYTICTRYGFSKIFALYSLLIIILLGFSETYFNRPFFMGLTLLHVVYSGLPEIVPKEPISLKQLISIKKNILK